MSDKKVIYILAAITVAILGGAITFLGNGSPSSAKVNISPNVKLSVDQKTFDWGQIPINGGNVNKTFTIKNTGTEDLKLFNVKTSCHCTKAQITINGVTSPSFGMDSISPWVGEVPPGSKAQLNVVFDPAYHGANGRGPITRYISVSTNDVNNQKLEFTLTANVI